MCERSSEMFERSSEMYVLPLAANTRSIQHPDNIQMPGAKNTFSTYDTGCCSLRSTYSIPATDAQQNAVHAFPALLEGGLLCIRTSKPALK